MKYIFAGICIAAAIVSCGDQSSEPQYQNTDTSAVAEYEDDAEAEYEDDHKPDTVDVFSGSRFRNVKVEKTGDSTFEIKGEAQVFEASFSWVIEDGHNELKQGHGTTDAGAPTWGKFEFEVTAAKQPNAIPHLILFEASAKDGSRQHELPIILYRD